MINILEVSEKFQGQWLALDKSQRVVDYGPDLKTLSLKHRGKTMTFYFAAGLV
ncbi:MAG: hypothetical protein KGO96_10785 [Elusimicrobia bacterium]|nr:hypothetical protein [Elusimicrobiota bacterium]MDE2426378.1 hypothetical protein [Elusimicrobiota bacterium]